MPIRDNVEFTTDLYGPNNRPLPRISRRGLGGEIVFRKGPKAARCCGGKAKEYGDPRGETTLEAEEIRSNLVDIMHTPTLRIPTRLLGVATPEPASKRPSRWGLFARRGGE